jgi:hypothetical protein
MEGRIMFKLALVLLATLSHIDGAKTQGMIVEIGNAANCIRHNYIGVATVRFAALGGFAYTILCANVNGSGVEGGCRFLIVSKVDWLKDAFGVIEGVPSGRVVIFLPNIGCYKEVLAYDLHSSSACPVARTNISINRPCIMYDGMCSYV